MLLEEEIYFYLLVTNFYDTTMGIYEKWQKEEFFRQFGEQKKENFFSMATVLIFTVDDVFDER